MTEHVIPERMELNVAEAMRLALDFYAAGDVPQAEQLVSAVVTTDPLNVHAHNLLGLCRCEGKRWGEALASFDAALVATRNDLVAVSCNRGMVLGELGRSVEALALFESLIRAYPEHTLSYLNRGILRMQVKRFAEAVADFEVVIAREPHNVEAIYSRGFANLVLGNYSDGFRDFEHRKKDEIDIPDLPQWTGAEALEGKSILVHGEQGHGDTIQFLRYVPLLQSRGAKVFLVLHPGIRPLAEDIPGVTLLAEDRSDWSALDFWTPIMSLARAFGTTIDTVPPPLKLRYRDVVAARWLKRIPSPDPLNIGLVWSGNRISKYDANRSVPLAAFMPLFDKFPYARFYSLQKDVRESDQEAFAALKARGLIDLEPHLTDFRETAHAMALLNLMITCDTSVAHMAGTVGVPTWIMLTDFRTYWLWTHDRQNCPWYPSVRLFRQQTDGDWDEVVGRVKAELSVLV